MEPVNDTDRLNEIKEAIAQLFESENVELVELSLLGRGRQRILRFLVDKPGGITLKECSQLNLRIGEILDNLNIIEERYTLEVSSPGLDRPLREKRDFERAVGKLIRFTTVLPVEGKTNWVAEIKNVEADKLAMTKLDGGIMEIPLSQISNARIEIEF